VAHLRSAGERQQAAYRVLTRNPELLDGVLAAAPPELHGAVLANVEAGRALAGLHAGGETPPQADLPEWRIVDPPPPGELLELYREAEAAFGVPWAYLAAVHLVETRMSRIQGTSVAGAQGPMQFMPPTWEAYGEGGDVTDDRQAILGAGRYLAASGAPEDMDAALFAYNPDVRYVTAVSAYAERMLAEEGAFGGYYHWQVYFSTAGGVLLLPVGYPETAPVPAPD
jgi:soluble lytic murein transglycosylase-like protein